MILNTFIKKNGYQLTQRQKSKLGINIYQSFKSRHPETILKKVQIREKEKSIQVYDYPQEYLLSAHVSRLVLKFIRKGESTNKKNNQDETKTGKNKRITV
jgi:hypothetical protein